MVHSSGILAKNINIGASLAVQWLRACFQCRGCSFNRWSGNWDAICCAAWQNKSSDAGAQLGPIKLASLGKRPMSQCFSTQVMLTSRIKNPLGGFPASSALSLVSSHLCLDFHAFLLVDRVKLRVWDFFQGPELFRIFPSADCPVIMLYVLYGGSYVWL